MKFIGLSICFLLTFSSIASSQTKATSDPLKAYTKCKVPDDLNQDDKNSLARAIVGGGERKFHNINEYRSLRDDFLTNYSECLARLAATQP